MDTPSPYQAQERFPVTPAMRHTVFRSYPSQPELDKAHEQMERSWSHIRPNSVLVAAMGNHWRQGSWNRVIDMVDYASEHGMYAALQEIQDRCFDPYDALGTMRNEAILTALGEGFQYLCYIDNDIQPAVDTLYRLVQWQLPVVAPYVAELGTGTRLFGPGKIEPNSGVQRAKWSVLSMLLFQTAVFKSFGPEFWRDAIGADEGYHFQKLSYAGVPFFIDTSIQLEVAGRPLFPLALNRLSSGSMRDVEQAAKGVAAAIGSIFKRRNVQLVEADEAELTGVLVALIRASKGDRNIKIQEKIERFVEVPDRRPIDPSSPWMKDGEYAPFIVKAEQAAKAQASQGQTPQLVPSPNGAREPSPQAIANALHYSVAGNAGR